MESSPAERCRLCFWRLCLCIAITSWICVLIEVVLLGLDLIHDRVGYPVALPCFVIGCTTTALAYEHSKSRIDQVGYDVWQWSIHLVASLGTWSIMSLILFVITYVVMKQYPGVMGQHTHPLSFFIFIIGNMCMLTLFLVLHVLILYNKNQESRLRRNSQRSSCRCFSITRQIAKTYYRMAVPLRLLKMPTDLGQRGTILDPLLESPTVTSVYAPASIITLSLNNTDTPANGGTALLPNNVLLPPPPDPEDSHKDLQSARDTNDLRETPDTNDTHAPAHALSSHAPYAKLEALASPVSSSSPRVDTQVTTGWVILTWQLFAIELYCLSSQKLGVERLNFSWQTQAFFYCLALMVHGFILLVAVRLCHWFLKTFDGVSGHSSFGHVSIPLFMGFFAVLERSFQVISAMYLIAKPTVLTGLLGGIHWYDQLLWGYNGIFVSGEIYALYLIFKIVFLKPVPSLGHGMITQRQHLMMLHIQHAMLAYGTSTMFIAVLTVVLLPKIWFQSVVSLEFSIFGDLLYCHSEYFTPEDSEYEQYCGSSHEESESWATPQATEESGCWATKCGTDDYEEAVTYYAYYYVALVLFLTLGRANRISLLWRFVCEILDSLVSHHKQYLSRMSVFNLPREQPAHRRISDVSDSGVVDPKVPEIVHANGPHGAHGTHGAHKSPVVVDAGDSHQVHKLSKASYHDPTEIDEEHHKGHGHGKQTFPLTGVWRGVVCCGVGVSLFFATRCASQFGLFRYGTYGTMGVFGVFYCLVLVNMILKMHLAHKDRCKINGNSYWRFDLKPSQWMFLLVTMVAVTYQAVFVNLDNEATHLQLAFIAMLCLQAVAGVGGLRGASKTQIGLVVFVDVIFCFFVICRDLSEQLEIEEMLAEEMSEGKTSFNIDIGFGELFASSVFFANMEHFWGMMESCQEAIHHYGHSQDTPKTKLDYVLSLQWCRCRRG